MREAACTPAGVNLLAVAQVTPAGVAVTRLRLGAGAHALVARFVGTVSEAASLSPVQPFTAVANTSTPTPTVTILQPPTEPSSSSYLFQANVYAPTAAAVPTGTVGFQVQSGTLTTSLGTAALAAIGGAGGPSYAPASAVSNVTAAALGDFNEDGIPDLVNQAIVSDITPSLMLGVGDGTFGAAQPLTGVCAQADCLAVLASDLNGDGHLDIAAFQAPLNGEALSLVIAYGHGDGSFAAPITVALPQQTGGSGSVLQVGDFNGDGRPDLLVTGEVLTTAIQLQATVLLQAANGTFQPSAPINLNYFASFFVEDLNNDGLSDVLSFASPGTFGADANVVSYLSNGDGTFTAKLSDIPGFTFTSSLNHGFTLASADVRGTGSADLVLANGDLSWAAALFNDGHGGFTPQANFGPGASHPVNMGAGGVLDLNNDGRADLVFVNAGASTGTGGCTPADYALLSNGDGTFTTEAVAQFAGAASCETPGPLGGELLADVNGDGRLDFVSTNYGSVLLNTTGWGAATASLATNSPVQAPGTQIPLSAVYKPTGSFAPSSSGTAIVNGTRIPTTTTVSVPATALFNNPVTLSATVSPVAVDGLSTDGGTMMWQLVGPGSTGYAQDFSAPVAGGTATLTVSTLALGQYTVTATYLGNADFGYSSSAAVPLQIYVPSPGDPLLQGNYVFHFHGTLPPGDGSAPGVAAVGWFHADGAGNVTAGAEDYNASIFNQTGSALTGSYALQNDGTGTLTLVNAQGIPQNFAVIGNPPTTTFLQGGVITRSTQISLLGLSNQGAVLAGTGVVEPASPPTFVASGIYLLHADGETDCGGNCGAHGGGQASLVSTLTQSGGVLSGTSVENAGGSVGLDGASSWTFGAADANGRVTATSSSTFGFADQPTHYVGYWASPTELFLLSIDPHASQILLSGSLVQQVQQY